MTAQSAHQILKTRDDPTPITLQRSSTPEDPTKPFRLSANQESSWASHDDALGPRDFRPRIEPWLTALLQSEHLSLLVGSGLTHAVHHIATGTTSPAMAPVAWSTFGEEIKAEAARTATAAGREAGNLEDQVRAVNALLAGLQIVATGLPEHAPEHENIISLQGELDRALHSFTASLLESERNLTDQGSGGQEEALNYLISFLMTFASRTGTRERLHIFTTNYDRLLEAGADAAGLRLIDRFIGMVAPIFRASRLEIDMHYSPPGIRGEPHYLEGVARFTKLHGSTDWVDSGSSIRRLGIPFGATSVEPYLRDAGFADAQALRLMIYPNAAKDRETASYPYVELFRDFAAAICRPNHTLFCYGYGFGDEHINRVIEDMLTIPSSHLVVISYDDPYDRIMSTYDRLGRHAQITLLIGDHLGNLRALGDHYLPKPAIDLTTSRMSDLLKARWNNGPRTPRDNEESSR